MLRHDKYIEQLISRLEGYQNLTQNVPIRNKKCTRAEIDLIGVKDQEIHVFEVKCSYRMTKAKKQLARIKRLLPFPIVTFFYCGSADALKRI